MVKVEASRTVNAAPDRVFALITDFERLPERFPARYRSVKVLQRSDGNGSNGSALVTVEEDVTVAGREMHQKTQHTLENGSVLRSEVIEGDAKGTVVEIRLAPAGSGETRVDVSADLKLGKLGSMLGVFAKGRIKEGLDRMIGEFEAKARQQR
ncbi:SRPBCC family protein [Nitrososphaera sp.]|uniref:type II toxin-antitoxin system RatA family toxin n=1 Tax=Nitrososphaera sp. TaxID=1971748 RepID=UPI00307D4179